MRRTSRRAPQQWAAITAPLEPGGRDRRRRLRQDHADGGPGRLPRGHRPGPPRPGARPDLHHQGRQRAARPDPRRAAARPGCCLEPRPTATTTSDVLEPTVATYNAYAASLLTDHGLRIGHEPDTRVITDASRYQLGARAVDRSPGEVRHLTDHPPTAIQNLLALDGAMSEHLVGARRRARLRRARPSRVPAGARAERGAARAARPTASASRRRSTPSTVARELLGLVEAYRRLKRDLGLMDFSDQIELGARLAVEQPDVGALERDRFRVVLLDEYQDTSVAQATMLSRLFSASGHAGHRGRRPQPGDLRLARGLGLQHPQLRRHLPGAPPAGGADVPAHRQPALRPPHPRGRQPAGRAALRRTRPGRARSAPSPMRREGDVSDAGSSRRTPRSSAWLVDGSARPTTARRRAGPTSAC